MIDHVDHIVLTTRDLDACVRFYTEVLGMKLERFRTPTEERLGSVAFREERPGDDRHGGIILGGKLFPYT